MNRDCSGMGGCCNSGDRLPPSPPAEKAAICQDQTRQTIDWPKLTDAVVPEKQTVKMLNCSSLNNGAQRRQPLFGLATDHQSRAGTSQDPTKAAIRRIAMGSARSGA